jgi:ATP-binding cassette subfamily B protein
MARNKFDVDEELDAPFKLTHFKRLLGYLKPYKKQMILTVFLMLMASGANLVGPYLIKQAIDVEIPSSNTALSLLVACV